MLERTAATWLGTVAAAALAGASATAFTTRRRDHQRLQAFVRAIEALDAAVSIFIEGDPPIRNRQALALARRAGATLLDTPTAAPAVYDAEGLAVPPADQFSGRAARGEEFSDLLHWFGEPGDQVAVHGSARQLRDRRGARVGTLLVGWEVTDLHQSIRVRDEFISTVSHELRTPLTSILGYLEILEEDPDDADARRHLIGVVNRNARTLKTRIDLLLTSRQLERDDAHLQPVPTDVTTLAATMLEDHRLELDRAGIATSAALEDGVVAHLDPTAFRQVCDNLVSNVIKYAAGTTMHVRLALRPTADQLVLVVADAGPGMTQHDARRAFERFYRSEDAVRGVVPGMGVGLALTQRLVEMHGGTIDITSAVGRGTTVRAVLPLKA